MAPIPVAVVEDQGWQNDDGYFRAFMSEISTGDHPIINLTLGSQDETLSLLENNCDFPWALFPQRCFCSPIIFG